MLSLRVWGSVVSSVLAMVLVVTLVEPAGAIEGDADGGQSVSDVVVSAAGIPSDVPDYSIPVPELPSGDFSDSFPALEDDPDDDVVSRTADDVPKLSVSEISDGVEVDRDEFSVTRVVDGFTVAELSSVPVSLPGVNGQWVPIGTDFEAENSGSVVVSDNPLNPVVTDLASGAGVLSVTDGDVSLRTQLLGALTSDVSVSSVDGSEAAVFDSALPNGGLEITAGLNWVKENVVLDQVGTASSWAWRVTTEGLTLAVNDGGDVVASDVNGVERFRFIQPLAWDSASNPSVISLTVSLVSLSSTTHVLRVSAPKEWLTDPDRAYPVVIDPSLQKTYSDSTVTAYKSDGATRTDSVHVGNSRDSSSNKYWRSVVTYNFSNLANKQILGAQLLVSYSNYGTTTNQPGSVSTTTCNGYSCVGTKLATFSVGSGSAVTSETDMDLAHQISDWVIAGTTTKRLMIRGDENPGEYTYKMLNTTVHVAYKDFPSIEATLPDSLTPTTTGPMLEADVTDPMGLGLRYLFEIFGSKPGPAGLQADTANIVASSDWIEDDHFIPAPGALSTGTYFYKVSVKDMFDPEYLHLIGKARDAYFEVLSEDKSSYVRFTVEPDVTQPDQDAVSIAPGAVITDYIPTITVPLPASNLPITKYSMSVTSNPDGLTGNIVTSGLLDVPTNGSALEWRVPSGTLRDGGQYYLTIRTAGANGLGYPAWVTDFTLNRRLGFDSPSPMEDIGALGVNLASGNVTATVDTPTVSTAGGEIGFSFNYNSHDESVRGLTGSYYDTSSVADMTTWAFDGNNPVLKRQDAAINFNLGSGQSPAPGVRAEKYAVRWEGLVTLPTGNYFFGMKHNNGAKITVGGVTHLNAWNDTVRVRSVDFVRNKSVNFVAGVPQQIQVDFYQTTSKMQAVLFVAKYTTASVPDWVPLTSEFLSVSNEILPAGWSTSSILAGAAARYASVDVLDSSVIVKDTSGGVHTYKETSDGGFEAPIGEYGVLSLTEIGTVTLTEDDGTVYQFRDDGKLESMTAPGDGKNPTQPVITYQNNRVYTISDPLSAAVDGTLQRSITFTYGDPTSSNCNTSTVVSNAPAGMLCKIEYPSTSGNGTKPATVVEYSIPTASTPATIVSITNPGGEKYSMNYAATTTETVPQLIELVTPFGNDLRASNVAYTPSTSTPKLDYDLSGSVSRPSKATLPQPSGTGLPVVNFVWGVGATTTTLESNPEMKHTVTYDDSWRETSSTSAMGYTSTKTWGAYDSLTRVFDNSTGLMTARRFDRDGRVTDVYGPAPATCFSSEDPVTVDPSCPIVPGHQHTDYDTTIFGLAATMFTNKNFTGTPTGFDTLLDEPVIVGVDAMSQPISGTGISVPAQTVTGPDSGSAIRLTGLVTFPSAGDWWVKATTDQSVTLTVSDIRQGKVSAETPVVVKDVTSAPITVHDNATGVTASHRLRQRIRLEVGYLNATGTTTSLWWKNGAAGSWEAIPTSAFSPDYGLTTSTQTDDSANGVFANRVHNAVTNYTYTTPWLGQVTSTSSGDGNAMLTSTATFENPTATESLNRLLSTTMPSGSQETYTYYAPGTLVGSVPSNSSTACGVPSGTVIGGLLKTRTDTAGIVTQFVYDAWGRTVGSKTTGDYTWSCTKYDSRGRTTEVFTSGFGTTSKYSTSITTTTTYNQSGDPRQTRISDGTHTTNIKVDTLGRTISTTDSLGTVTTTQYDPVTGRVASATSTTSRGAAHTTAYTYDLDGKVLTISRNNATVATLSYSAATARLTGVSYPDGIGTTFGYGPTGSVDSKTYTTPHGTYTESLTRSQSGRILADVFTDPTGVTDATNYTYDAYGRLVTAELSDQTFDYGFDPVAGCGVQNAGVNGNRTTQTHTVGTTSTTDTYCYTAGDRLSSASQVNGAIMYDLHGNITALGDVSFTYDSLDRHVTTTLPNGSVITLERDVDGSILTRTVTGSSPEVVKYSSGVVQFYLDVNKNVTGTALSLPGGVTLSERVGVTTTTFQSLQGHACLTSTAASTTRTRFDPFGTPLTALSDTLPGTAEPGFGTVAGKLTDTLTPFGLIEMGARFYSTVLGRFLQVDPVPGGGVNAYAYPPDPVNTNDYSGQVATADSYDSWDQHNAKPTFDGNFASVPAKYSKLREGRQKAAILGILSGVLGIAAMLVIAGNPVTLAGWAALTIASTALGLLSTHQSCSIQRKSFDCIFGMVAVGIGGIGSIATVASRTLSVGHLTWGGISAVSDATNVASFGITSGTSPGLFPSRKDPWWTH